MKQSWQKISTNLLAVLLAITIAWHLPLSASFWLDESMTWWVVKGTFSELVIRSLSHQGQPLLYSAFLWSYMKVVPHTEMWLRLPSILFIVGAAIILHRIVSWFSDRETGALSLLFFLPLTPIQVAGVSLRPYAFGIFFSFLGIYALLRWIETSKLRWGIASGVALSFAVHANLFYAGAFLIASMILLVSPDAQQIRRKGAWLWALVFVLFSIPAFVQIFYWPDLNAVFSNIRKPGVLDLFETTLPLYLTVCVACALICAVIYSPVSFEKEAFSKRLPSLVIFVWYLLPPISFYAWSIISGNGFYHRWFLWHVPALALFWALLLQSIRSEGARKISILVFFLLVFYREAFRMWNPEEWRGAVSHLNQALDKEKLPVYLYSGLAETGVSSMIADPSQREFFTAPLSYYEVHGEVTPLPRTPVESSLKPTENFYLLLADQDVVSGQKHSERMTKRYVDYFSKLGFSGEELFANLSIHLYRFKR